MQAHHRMASLVVIGGKKTGLVVLSLSDGRRSPHPRIADRASIARRLHPAACECVSEPGR